MPPQSSVDLVDEVRPHFHTGEMNNLSATIRTGDAFELIHDVQRHSVDLILTSPPFWGLRSYGLGFDSAVDAASLRGSDPDQPPLYAEFKAQGGVLGLEPYPEWFIAHLVEFFAAAREALRNDGNVWVNLGDTYFARWSSVRDGGRQGYQSERMRRKTPSGGFRHDKQLLLIPSRFAIAMQESGWILRNDLIWAKTNVMPRPEVDRLRLSHEHWFHFVKRQTNSRPRYFYDLQGSEEGNRDVIFAAPGKGGGQHTATFPAAVVRPRILSSCPEGGLVLDPFCGTGTALVEARRLGRSGLGFELAPDYAEIARDAVARALTEAESDALSTARGG